MGMCGVSQKMVAALRDAPAKWQTIPEPFRHAHATLQALEDRHFIHLRIRGDGFYEWKVTQLGVNFDNTERGVAHV